MGSLKPKILYLVTEDWYFCSHRLPLACAAREAGYEVVVVTRVNHHGEVIRRQGFKLIPIDFARSDRAPWRDLRTLGALVCIYSSERPDIVHHVALKPVLYGSIAAAFTPPPVVINALTGLGYVFSSHWKARLLRPVVGAALRGLLQRPNTWLILQNQDDEQMLVDGGYANRGRISLIQGSGVDMKVFRPMPETDGVPVVVLASRMLWDKGVGEFVEAVRRLQYEGIAARFVLVGDTDSENPSAIPTTVLQQWRESGAAEWWGWHRDMVEVLSQAHVVCLPSYREGLPKILVEAAASGRPIVTTDTPGCRAIVRNGENGLLVPVRDPEALAKALKKLINDVGLRGQMGARGRAIAETEFSIERVVKETLALYERLLNRKENRGCAYW